jgi:peptide chain release factor 1
VATTPSSSCKTNSPSTASWGHGGVFSYTILTDKPGLLVFKASGKQAAATFANESGGHRWQRIPPTEKKGRRQTSTITVAVLPVPREKDLVIPEKDLDWKTCRGSGAGGQHKNVTDSAVQLTHLPTNISVRCESERSQHFNRATALEMLRARLLSEQRTQRSGARAADRRAQLGSGMRADKRRTIRVQDGSVVDHILGKKWNLKDYLRGNW